MTQVSAPRRVICTVDGMEVHVLDGLHAGVDQRVLVDQCLHRRAQARVVRLPIEEGAPAHELRGWFSRTSR
jgi:hypothetical protein